MVGKRAPTYERFLAKFTNAGPDDCWEWTASQNGAGYGFFWSLEERRKVLAHRYSYEFFVGPIPSGGLILHSCDNPACVNPAHLRVGTYKQNVEDMDIRGRRVTAPMPGSKNPQAKLTDTQVIALRRDYISGVPRDVLSTRYGVSVESLSDYTSGRSWKHLLGKEGGPALAQLKAATRTPPVSEAVAREVWRLHLSGKNSSDIAETVGQSIHVVVGLVTGKTGRSIPNAPSIKALKQGGVRRGYNQFSDGGNTRDLHPQTKISSSEIPAILHRIDAGETLQSIGETYGVLKTAIWRIKKAHRPA